jgi:pimeloyl-ACP methyl ester carboxylesterase
MANSVDCAPACKVIEPAKTDAPWMVMVHGMSQDRRVFSRQVSAFRSDFKILLVDLAGHGTAAAVPGPFGHLEQAEYVRRVMASNHVDNAHYWGTHTGATVGMVLAATYPGLIQCLILEGPVIPGSNPPVVVEAMQKAKSAARQDGVRAAIAQWWQESCWFDYMRGNPDTCRADEHLAIVKDFTGRPWMDDQVSEDIVDVENLLSRITVPSLIYNGVMDDPDFLSATRRLKGLLPDARTADVANSGGFPAWENPETTNKIVADFVAAI